MLLLASSEALSEYFSIGWKHAQERSSKKLRKFLRCFCAVGERCLPTSDGCAMSARCQTRKSKNSLWNPSTCGPKNDSIWMVSRSALAFVRDESAHVSFPFSVLDERVLTKFCSMVSCIRSSQRDICVTLVDDKMQRRTP